MMTNNTVPMRLLTVTRIVFTVMPLSIDIIHRYKIYALRVHCLTRSLLTRWWQGEDTGGWSCGGEVGELILCLRVRLSYNVLEGTVGGALSNQNLKVHSSNLPCVSRE